MEIQDIVKKYKIEGDSSVLNDLVLEYDYIISYILRNFTQYNYYEDLKQELVICLLNIVENYNLNSGAKFTTYAYKQLKYHVYRIIGEFSPIRRPPHIKHTEYVYDVFSNESSDKDYFSELEYHSDCIEINLRVMKNILSEKEFTVCYKYISGFSKTEIGKMLGCSSEYVAQLIKKSTKKLKNKIIT